MLFPSFHAILYFRDVKIIFLVLSRYHISWERARDQKELALVVSAKVEDEVRNATVEKAKEYITTLGGTITNVDEWGKKKLAYEIQKMSEGFYYFIQFDSEPDTPTLRSVTARVKIH